MAVSNKPEDEPKEEKYNVDILFEVKNWAMQNSKWRLLNVLVEQLSPAQLKYKCSNSKSVFENIALLVRLSLMNHRELQEDQSGMTIVKTYVHTTLFPMLVNKSLHNLTPSTTLHYLNIINQV